MTKPATNPAIAAQAEELATKYTKTLLIVLRLTTDDEAAIKSVLLEALTAAAAPPEEMVMAIREAVTALDKAEKQFTFYAENHTAAGKTEKAATNYGFAVLCGHAFERLKLLAAAEAPQEGE